MHTDLKPTISTRRFFILAVVTCLLDTAVLQAQAKPDLIVVDQWEVSGWVHFTLENTGAATAGTGHTTGLSVDDTAVDSVVVSSKILPGGTYSGSFPKYYWKCTADGSHTVVVRADASNTIDESNEKNNSREETWICDVTAPKITEGPKATSVTQTTASILWTTNENSDSVVKYGTSSGVYKFTRSNQLMVTSHAVSLDELKSDTTYYYRVESTDAHGNTVQSDEHTFRTLAEQVDLPDLYIADIWLQNDLVYFRIGNSGGASAAAGHTASLYIDGELKAAHEVTSAIAPNGSLDLAFKYTWVCPNPQPTVRVEADSADVIEEENEQNNSCQEVWPCEVESLEIVSGPTVEDITQIEATIIWTTNQSSDSAVWYGTASGVYTGEDSDATMTTYHKLRLEGLAPGTLYFFVVRSENPSGKVLSDEQTFRTQGGQSLAPDLIVDSIWEEANQIRCKIKNVGDGAAPANHRAGLYTSGHLVDSAMVTVPLDPGETADVTFVKFYFECHDAEHIFHVTADVDDSVFEDDETNNSLDWTVQCDVTPLRIIDGPVGRAMTTTTAEILWTTNKPSDSNALYDCYSGAFGLSKSSSQQTTEHTIHLLGLTPGTVYQFKARSATDEGQSVESKPGYFRTPSKGGKKPRINDITFEREPTDFPCYRMTANVEDENDVDKVEFFADGTLIQTVYSPPFQAVFAPGIVQGEFYRPWPTEAIVVAGDAIISMESLFEPAYECNQITAEFEYPFRNETFYVPDETAPEGTEIPIRVRGYMWSTILHDASGVELQPGESGFRLESVEWPLQEVRFYVNSFPIGTVPYESSDLYEIDWDAGGMPVGTHVLRADAVANGQCIQTITQDIVLEQGEPEIEVTRQVWREENAFRIRLNIRNVGTVSYVCDVVRDNVDGLQPIDDSFDDYRALNAPSPDGRHNDVTLDLETATSDQYEIEAGHTVRLEYYAIPIQFPGPGSMDYEIGEDAVEVVDRWGIDTWTIPCRCVRTEDDIPLDDEIDSAIEGSDYQIVTNPDLCASEYGGAADVLSEMARLAYHRNGILGYPSGVSSDDPVWIRDCIKMWGAGMNGSNGAAGGYLSNGYLLLVGETEILPSWTVNTTDVDWTGGTRSTEVEYSDLPYGDVASSDNVPELSVGRLIGDSAGALMQAIQSSLYTGFDRSYGVSTSGDEGATGDFVGRARDVRNVWVGQAEDGEIMTERARTHHWTAYVHKDQITDGFDFPMDSGDGFVTANLAGYGMSAIRVEPDTGEGRFVTAGNLDPDSTPFSGTARFVLPFGSHDALAAGDIDGDGEDEIVVGNLGLDRLVVVCDPPSTTSATYLGFDAELEAWDVIACGHLYDTWTKEVIVVARPIDGGTVDIYEYADAGGALGWHDQLDIPFSSYDGLVVADMDPNNPGDEIIIGSDSAQRIYLYDQRGNLVMEIPCEPYTAYDSLVGGDFDGDGADELAVLIDDVTGGKRRLHIFNNACVTYGASGWELIKNRSSLIYTRFLECEGARTTGGAGTGGVTCDDLDGDGREEICVAHVGNDRLYLLDGYYTRGWMDRYLALLQDIQDRIDVFVLNAHGSPDYCSPFGTGDVATLSLTTGPLVFALSCLTGNYEGNWCRIDSSGALETHVDGDDGIAETFLQQGAAVYIGATEVSPSGQNSAAGPGFMQAWDPSETAGMAFRNYRRSRAASGDAWWEFWAMEYNYYGDVKFGALDGGISGASIDEPDVSIAAAEPLPSNPEIELPDYESATVDGYDRVTIPGGDVLIEPNTPMVPIYRVEWEVAPGVVVQDVSVQQRSGLQTDIGLVLPVAVMTIDALNGSAASDVEPEPGWCPDRELDWRIIPGADGASTLAVTLYPFEYNAQTTESRFYKQYTLEIETLDSPVRINALLTDSRAYAPGDLVTVKLWLHAEGEAQDAFVDTAIRQYGSDELVAGLLLDDLSGLAGTASYAATWDSTGAAPGFYCVETTIVDTASQVLARETALFRIKPPQ
ncbi:MAG: CARDB domain-containing protein [Phycisphaerales bacterium]